VDERWKWELFRGTKRAIVSVNTILTARPPSAPMRNDELDGDYFGCTNMVVVQNGGQTTGAQNLTPYLAGR
jgi:hypothetical protein